MATEITIEVEPEADDEPTADEIADAVEDVADESTDAVEAVTDAVADVAEAVIDNVDADPDAVPLLVGRLTAAVETMAERIDRLEISVGLAQASSDAAVDIATDAQQVAHAAAEVAVTDEVTDEITDLIQTDELPEADEPPPRRRDRFGKAWFG